MAGGKKIVAIKYFLFDNFPLCKQLKLNFGFIT